MARPYATTPWHQSGNSPLFQVDSPASPRGFAHLTHIPIFRIRNRFSAAFNKGMTFDTLEKKLQEWHDRTERELLMILEATSLDLIQQEDARSLEQELWLIERLRCRIFFPLNRPRQEGEVTKFFMSMVLRDLSAEFIRQERYGLCFFLKTRQADLIGMCTEERMDFSMAS